MSFPLSSLTEYTESNSLTPDYTDEIKRYVLKLENNGVPIIFSLPHLGMAAGVSIDWINNIVTGNRQAFYKRFKLAKRSGGYRTIQSPESGLKYLQRWILYNILSCLPSHPASKAFDKGNSIALNASEHLNKDAILKIDLLRFFDSINEERVYGIFSGVGYHKNLAVTLAKLCTILPDNNYFIAFKSYEKKLLDKIQITHSGILPQGSTCSPKLANLIAWRLDNRLFNLAKKNNVQYSRYADDLTFSGNRGTLAKLKKVIYKIIEDENFFVNFGKTKLLVRGNRFFVTGLSIHNDCVRVPQHFKKEIEHHLHHCLKNGVNIHRIKAKIKNRNFRDWLLGKICFIASIEPEVGQKYYALFNKIEWPI